MKPPSIGPSESQLDNLHRMESVVAANTAALELVSSLWHFFKHQLYCIIDEADGRSSKYRVELESFQKSRNLGDLKAFITLKKSDRIQEALVHELLHLKLIALGYPRFVFKDAANYNLATGIINNCDHVAMLPLFLAMGYEHKNFLGPSGPLTPLEAQVITEISLIPGLTNPTSYRLAVATLLKSHSISFDCIDVLKLSEQTNNS